MKSRRRMADPSGSESHPRARAVSRALADATSDEERERAVESAVSAWAEARADLVAAVPGTERTTDPERFRRWLAGRRAQGVGGDALADEVEQRFARLTALAAEAGTPGGWADRWRTRGPALAEDEYRTRVIRASEATARSAQSTGEAVRSVLAARRAEGAPLYQTYAAGLAQRYIPAVAAAELDLNPAAPQGFPPPGQRTPWGTFQVRSHLPPETAESLFDEAPPLPARPDVLQARSVPARLEPLIRDRSDGAAPHHAAPEDGQSGDLTDE